MKPSRKSSAVWEAASGVSADPERFWKRPALPLLGAFAAGLFWARMAPLSPHAALGFSALFLGLCALPLLLPAAGGPVAPFFRVGFPCFFFRFFPLLPVFFPLCALLFLGHALGLGVHRGEEEAQALAAFAGNRKVVVEGRVEGLPRPRHGRIQSHLRALRVTRAAGETLEVRGRLMFSLVGGTEMPPPGSRVRFQGKIRSIGNFDNPGGFDYRKFQHGRGILGRVWCRSGELAVLDTGAGGFSAGVDRFRMGLAEKIRGAVGEGDAAAVLRAMLIGDRGGLSPALREAYGASGLGHLLAISGLHVGLLAGGVFWAAERGLRRASFLVERGCTARVAAFPALMTAVAYGLVSGGAPSALRAVIMVCAGLWLLALHRGTDPWSLLAAAVGILLAENPERIVDTGFLLSVSAVSGLLLGFSRYPMDSGKHEGRGGWIRGRISGLFRASLFAALFTAPVCLFVFREVSLAGPVANLIMVPLMGMLALPLGMAGLLLCFFLPAGDRLLQAAGLLTDLGNLLAAWTARLPAASLRPLGITLLEAAILYGFLMLWLGFRKEEGWTGRRFFWLAVLVCLAGLDGARWLVARLGPEDPEVTVLDVGQGSAAGVRLPGGRVMLVDGGGFPWAEAMDTGRLVLAPWLDFQKIRTVDVLVLSHPHADHIQGFFHLAERYRVRELWISASGLEDPAGRRLAAVLAARGTRIRSPASGGEVFFLGDTAFRFFGTEKGRFFSANDASLVFRMETPAGAMLFTGDAEKAAEGLYAERYGKGLASDVLLAGHHGSRTSSTRIFLDAVRPSQALISCGRENPYRYPSRETLERFAAAGSRVLRTDRGGAIRVVFGEKGVEARYRPMGAWDRVW